MEKTHKNGVQPDDVEMKLIDDTQTNHNPHNKGDHESPWFNEVLEDLREHQESNAPMENSLFYRIVLGGNVECTQKFLEYLSVNNAANDLEYILKTTKSRLNGNKMKHPLIHNTTSHYFMSSDWWKSVAIYGFLVLISLVLTPLFYWIHAATNAVNDRRRNKRKSLHSIPLAIAALSGNPKMFRLFKSYGCEIDFEDENNNNIFHALFWAPNLKPWSTMKVFEAFKIVCKEYKDVSDMLRHLILDANNSDGVTPLELLAKDGSSTMLNLVANVKGMLRHPLLDVSRDLLVLSNVSVSERNRKSTASFGFLDEEELEIKIKTGFENQQTVLTSQETMKPATYLDFTPDPTKDGVDYYDITMYEKDDGKQSLLLNYISNRAFVDFCADDLHSVHDTGFLNEWIRLKIKAAIAPFSLVHISDVLVTMLVLFQVLHFGGDVTTFPLDLHFKNVQSDILNERIAEARRIFGNTQFEVDSYVTDPLNTQNVTITTHLYNQFSVDYSEYLYSLKDVNISEEQAQFAFEYVTTDKYISVPFEETYQMFCGGDTKGNNVTYDMCYSDIIAEITELCEGLNISDVEEYLRTGDGRTTHGFQLKYSTLSLIGWVLFFVSLMYIILDQMVKVTFIYRYVWLQKFTSLRKSIKAVCSNRIPGSYPQKQLHISSACSIVSLAFAFIAVNGDVELPKEDHETRVLRSSVMLITVLVTRFFAHIHSLRLYPGVGHFVNTACKMAKDLMHFSIVYLIVVVLFAVLFNILVRDPNCPLASEPGMTSVLLSVFATFKLSIGQAELNDDSTLPVKAAYILFVLICVLLLMNMIIAVMSNTVTAVMSQPLRDVTFQGEWLKEALGMEFNNLILLSIMRMVFRKRYPKFYRFSRRLRRVKEADNEKVYVKVYRNT